MEKTRDKTPIDCCFFFYIIKLDSIENFRVCINTIKRYRRASNNNKRHIIIQFWIEGVALFTEKC